MFENSDDYDFTPVGSSKLSSLFGTAIEGENPNNSLFYTAPKQPKSEVEGPENASNCTLVCVKIVNLWKLGTDGAKQPLGKHGLAIYNYTESNLRGLFIYKEKKKILIRVALKEDFFWYDYTNNFGAFHDNDNQGFLVQFEKEDDTKCVLDELQKSHCKLIIASRQNEQEKENVTENNSVQDTFDESETQSKKNILSRITKMGQQILPQTKIELTDSESESKPAIAPRKSKRNQLVKKSEEPEKEQELIQPQNFCINPTVYTQPFPDLGLSNFLLTQSVDMRSSFMQINSKLDQILGTTCSKNSEVDSEVTILKSKIKTMQLKIDNLESQVSKKTTEINALVSANQLQSQETKAIEMLEQELGMVKDERETLVKNHSKCNSTIEVLNKTIIDLQKKLSTRREEEADGISDKNDGDVGVSKQSVKENLDAMYRELRSTFHQENSYRGEEIQQKIQICLRNFAYKILK